MKASYFDIALTCMRVQHLIAQASARTFLDIGSQVFQVCRSLRGRNLCLVIVFSKRLPWPHRGQGPIACTAAVGTNILHRLMFVCVAGGES